MGPANNSVSVRSIIPFGFWIIILVRETQHIHLGYTFGSKSVDIESCALANIVHKSILHNPNGSASPTMATSDFT